MICITSFRPFLDLRYCIVKAFFPAIDLMRLNLSSQKWKLKVFKRIISWKNPRTLPAKGGQYCRKRLEIPLILSDFFYNLQVNFISCLGEIKTN